MINVFFKGRGRWYYTDLGDVAERDYYLPCNDIACGVFKLTERDEIAYRHTGSLEGVKVLLPSIEHPDCEFSRGVRDDHFDLVAMQKFLTLKDADVCFFEIDQSRAETLIIAEPCPAERPPRINPPETRHKTDIPDNNWILTARKIGEQITKESPNLSVDKIAKKVNSDMTTRKNNGEPDMTGRGGKVPSAETIKRHALAGIKS